jgi:hypothetical protein
LIEPSEQSMDRRSLRSRVAVYIMIYEVIIKWCTEADNTKRDMWSIYQTRRRKNWEVVRSSVVRSEFDGRLHRSPCQWARIRPQGGIYSKVAVMLERRGEWAMIREPRPEWGVKAMSCSPLNWVT